MKTFIFVLVLLSVTAECTLAGNPAYFYYRNENKPLLRYYRFQNVFDSSRTTYVFGEAAMACSGATHRIAIDTSIELYKSIAGINGTGEDTVLRASARTQNLVLTGGATFSWFSELSSFRSPCDPGTVHPGEGEGPNVPTPAWAMLDRSEFVVELVRTDNNTRLAVLDSVGVVPPRIGVLADTRYGTNPQSVLKRYTIPVAWNGIEAYLRVSPRRYGPTPYGMVLCTIKNWVNFSARYDSAGITYIPEQEYIDLSNTFFSEILGYCDSVKNATGWLPRRVSEGIGFSLAESNIFHARYFTEHTDSISGQKIWIEIPAWVWAKKGVPPKFERNVATIISIQKIIPNPSSGRITLVLMAKFEQQVVIQLYSRDGRVIRLWSGFVQEGENSIPLMSGTIAAGAYTLVVEGTDGTPLASAPLIINR
jgi:hypothetical protein